MSGYRCPSCDADLDADLVTSTGSAECPFCGEDASEVFPQSDFGLSSTSGAAENSSWSEQRELDYSGLPEKSQIQIIESTYDRLVLFVPPGSNRAAGIGCFAFFWLAITATVSGAIVLGGDGPPAFIAIPFFGIFWLIGLGMLYWFVSLKFTRTTILIQPDKAAIQKILFGKRGVTETALKSTSAASLVESYRENDKRVDKIAIEGDERVISFGTRLDEDEKSWLVTTINQFLGVTPQKGSQLDRICPHCDAVLDQVRVDHSEGTFQCPNCEGTLSGNVHGSEAKGEPARSIPVSSLSMDSIVTVEEHSEDRLRISWPASIESPGRKKVTRAITGMGLVALLFGLFGGGFIGLMRGQVPKNAFDFIVILVPMVFSLFPAIGLLMLARAIRNARIRVTIDRENVDARLKFAWFNLGNSKPTRSVENIVIGRSNELTEKSVQRQAKSLNLTGDGPTAHFVIKGEKPWPMTTNHTRSMNEEIAGVIAGHLNAIGYDHVGA